ncbi:bifunctional 4-hydroxy-2-oxoglutarate aldolase/2-dehydro-3-deoxy-phosphogluconate aldolase, partial [Schumannella luteola]
AAARAAHPGAAIGMGTVTSAVDAELAIEHGASFLVSPFPAPAVRAVAADHGVRFAEGGSTPGEIAAAAQHGLCKLFPAHLGGVAYLRTLLAVLPHASIMPTGGIRIADVGAWLTAGAVAVGVGSDLYSAPDVAAAVAELRAQLETASTP